MRDPNNAPPSSSVDGGVTTQDAASASNDGGQHGPLLRSFLRFDIEGMENPDDLAVGDINGDGTDDIVVIEARSDQILLHALLAKGGARFERSEHAVPLSSSRFVQLADVTGDGRVDVIVSSGAGFAILAQTSAGTLTEPMSVLPPADGYVGELAVGDLNGDGRLDILAKDDLLGRLLVYLQQANGALSPARSFQSNGRLGLSIADVTGDRRVDILELGETGVFTHAQRADGAFENGVPSAPDWPTLSRTPQRVESGSLAQSGVTEVLVTTNEPRESAWYIDVLTPISGGLRVTSELPTYAGASAMRLADIDGDGLNDIVVFHGGYASIGLYLQQTDGSMAPEIRYSYASDATLSTRSIGVGDVTGDGKPDVVAVIPRAIVLLVNER